MSSKSSIRIIIRDHLATLYDGDVEPRQPSRGDWLTYIWMPAFVGSGLAILGWLGYPVCLTKSSPDTLITSLSLLGALLFALLILLYQETARLDFRMLDPKDIVAVNNAEQRLETLRETYANTSFSILEAMAAVTLLVVTRLAPLPWKALCSGLALGMCLAFSLTLLMILKRVQLLFNNEVRSKGAPPKGQAPLRTIIGPPR